jgi:hypothetical protein
MAIPKYGEMILPMLQAPMKRRCSLEKRANSGINQMMARALMPVHAVA